MTNATMIVEDDLVYEQFKIIAMRNKTSVTQMLWSFVAMTVKQDQEAKINPPSMDSFTAVTPPPRIIEDFDNVIRPYLNKANPETLKLVMDSGYACYVYAKYLILADRHGVMSHEQRVLKKVSYEQATEGLEWLSHMKGDGYVKDETLLRYR